MTEIQKSQYYNIVKKLSEQHKLYHPNYMYHYRPRKRSKCSVGSKSAKGKLTVTVLKAKTEENILQNAVS